MREISSKPTLEQLNKVSEAIIGAAIEVHRHLGPGLLESVYQQALAHEFDLRGIAYLQQLDIQVIYKAARMKTKLRVDFLVEDCVLVDLKAVKDVRPIDEAQLLTYIKLTDNRLGLLLNFNVIRLRDGIKRMIL